VSGTSGTAGTSGSSGTSAPSAASGNPITITTTAPLTIDGLSSAQLSTDRTLALNVSGNTDGGIVIWESTLSNSLEVSPSIKVEDINSGTNNNLALSADAAIELGTGGDNATDYSGIAIKLGTTSVTAGKIYYFTSGGAWALADKDTSAAATSLLGYAFASAASGGIMLQGVVSSESHGHALGAPLYVKDSGAFNTTAPTSSGDFVRIIGYAINEDQIYFDPDKTFVERG